MEAPAGEPLSTRKTTILLRGLTRRCPRCGRGGLFRRWIEMVDACPRCDLVFDQEEGYWTGALVVNTMVSLTLFAVLIGAVVGVTWPDIPVFRTMAVGVVTGIAFPFLYYPYSKTFWVALDLAWFHPERMRSGTGLTSQR